MRILAAADIHGALGVYAWLAQLAEKHQPDLLVLPGDLFAGFREDGQRQQAHKIIALLQRVSAPVLYLMGNDDFVALDYEDERIRAIHGRRVEIGGYNFVGYQYSLPFVGGIFEKPENEIERDVRSLEELLDERTVFVTHSPVFGILDRVYGGQHVGSRSLAALLEHKPFLAHLHGHIHEDFGRDGKHFNVAAAAQRRAVLIELPSLEHRVLRA